MSKIKEQIISNEKEFDEKCTLTIDGSCKYWKPESIGYAQGDNEMSMYKFFPEEIKAHLQSSQK